MSGMRSRTRRGATSVTLLVGGAVLATATWIGGSPAWAVGTAVAFIALAAGAFVWAGGSGDTAAILGADRDERQRGLDRDATAVTGVVMVIAALAGAVISIGRTGNPGGYGLLCLVGGVAYAGTLAVLRMRR
jgi:hypothetical protein